MRKLALFAALVCSSLALSPGGEPGSRPAASSPAVPPVPVKRISALVSQLGSDQYHLRRSARSELAKLLELPGVYELLKARLEKAADAEIKASLEEILDGYDMPLAMVWYRGGLTSRPYEAAAPWLFIDADGSFFYEATSDLFAGTDSFKQPFRQGKLSGGHLLAVKRMIDASDLARGAAPVQPRPVRAPYLRIAFYVRSGSTRRLINANWLEPHLRRQQGRPPAKAPAELKLAAALADFLAARESRPFEGPLAVQTIYNSPETRGLSRQKITKLPDWPVAGINIRSASARRGVAVSGAQLKEVRAALAKSSLYKYHARAACKVVLVPYVERARQIYFAPRR